MAKKTYEVRGTVTVEVFKRVKANDEHEAIELAEQYLSGLTEYCGNGGTDKLIGVEEESESVQTSGDYVEWHEACETDDDRYDKNTDEFTLTCNICGEVFCYNSEYDDYESDLWAHLETDHEDEYAKCENWNDWEMIKEYFEREN